MSVLTFAYTALDASGARKSGSLEAETREAAVAKLAAEGRFVLEIKESSRTASVGGDAPGRKGAPSRQDLALFTRRLSDLASAGLPLDRVLQVVAEQSESQMLKHICEEALVDVRGGMPVSQALAKHPKFFNSIFTQTLHAGEASGQFGEVAGRLADYQEKEVARRSQIIGALIYPCILACTAVSVVLFIFAFVLPRLSPIFKSMGNQLPVTTQMLMATSDFLTKDWAAVLVGLAAVIIATRTWMATEHGAETRDRFLLTAPAIGPVVSKATVSRFARVLGTLVYGGVPILDALEIAGLSANNRVFLRSAEAVEEEVRSGRPIADAMRDAGAFPPVLTHMVAVGEETGDLPKMLGRVSDSMDFEVDNSMRRLVALVEPIIVLIMGTVVGFVALSVLLPIYQAESFIAK